MTRLRITAIMEYDANPASYGTDDPKEMAEIDLDNLNEGIVSLEDFFNESADVKIEVVN